MAQPTTIDNETELSAVNSILGAIGQSPVSSLNFSNPEVSIIYNLLKEANKDVQAEGWSFNREWHVALEPDSNGNIIIPSNVLQIDQHDDAVKRTKDVVRRNGKLYDRVNHTDVFTETTLYFDIVYLYTFNDLPEVFKRYITSLASTRAATQLISNPQLVQLLGQRELHARASCMEYECNQDDPTFFGTEHNSSYTSYKPFFALRR
tara:strand:+ start:1860 stop:2477 length:618 start_codon:yes stop_codon:yes gene_type:complete